MKHLLAACTSALALTLAPMAVSANARALSIQAEVMPASVSRTSRVEVSAVLTNVDPRRQVALRGEPGWTAGGGFSIEVVDPSGSRRTAKPEPGGMTLQAASTSSRRVVLMPGFGYGSSRVIDAKDLFPSTGTYTIRVIYQAPKPSNQASSVSGALEGEMAVSEPVSVNVTP